MLQDWAQNPAGGVNTAEAELAGGGQHTFAEQAARNGFRIVLILDSCLTALSCCAQLRRNNLNAANIPVTKSAFNLIKGKTGEEAMAKVVKVAELDQMLLARALNLSQNQKALMMGTGLLTQLSAGPCTLTLAYLFYDDLRFSERCSLQTQGKWTWTAAPSPHLEMAQC